MSEFKDFSVPLWPLGIDNVAPITKLRDGTLRNAVNVDLDVTGVASLRRGGRLVSAGSDMRSLWTDQVTGTTLVAYGTQLCTVRYVAGAWTLTPVATIPAHVEVSYTYVNGEIAFSLPGQTGLLDPAALTVRPLGVEDVLGWDVAAATYGGMPAGRYAVALSHIDDTGEEGGLSGIKFVQVTEGGGLTVTLPVPETNEVVTTRVYHSEPNGSELRRAYDFPAALTTAKLGYTKLGRVQENRGQRKMPWGHLVRFWRGRLYAAQYRRLYFSLPMRPGLTDPEIDHLTLPSTITLLEGVDGGLFVGSREGVFFFRGQRPGEFTRTVTSASAPIPNSAALIPASLLADELRRNDTPSSWVATWLTQRGYALGFSDGHIIEAQAKRILLPSATAGQTVLYGRRLITTVR